MKEIKNENGTLKAEGETMKKSEYLRNEKDFFENDKGELILKDSASRILLTLSFKYQLQGDFSRGDYIQGIVANHSGAFFNLDKELLNAQGKAINMIKKETETADTKDLNPAEVRKIIEPVIVKNV